MDFDHRDGSDKKFTIGDALHFRGLVWVSCRRNWRSARYVALIVTARGIAKASGSIPAKIPIPNKMARKIIRKTGHP